MPASRLTVMASLISGLGIADSASATTMKPGSEAITAPKPNSDAVFIAASSEPPTAVRLPSASLPRRVPKLVASTRAMPSSSAASTAQIAVSLPTSVTSGALMPGSCSVWLVP